MQFKVPQFLDIEDTIFGPFTFKQFIYLVGGGGLCYILYKTLGLLWALIPILLVGGFSLALAFYRPNNKPFINMVQSGFRYAVQDKLYVWKKKKSSEKRLGQEKNELSSNKGFGNNITKLTGNKLRDLAWSLDVLDLKKEDI
jgi:hypothetical protein